MEGERLKDEGKLFGKRVQSIVESHGSEYGPILRDIRSGPTVFMKYGERHVSLLYTFFSILLNDLCFQLCFEVIFQHLNQFVLVVFNLLLAVKIVGTKRVWLLPNFFIFQELDILGRRFVGKWVQLRPIQRV